MTRNLTAIEREILRNCVDDSYALVPGDEEKAAASLEACGLCMVLPNDHPIGGYICVSTPEGRMLLAAYNRRAREQEAGYPVRAVPENEFEVLQALREAAEAQRNANHAPYSNYTVLAAVAAGHGVFGGTNVENANYTLTKHAEEVAILSAITSSKERLEGAWIKAMYITTGCPCGSCRQFINEFAGPDTIIYVEQISQDDQKLIALTDLSPEHADKWTMEELLPASFGRATLERNAMTQPAGHLT